MFLSNHRATHAANTSHRLRHRAWLRVNVLENRVTPVLLPGLGTLPHPYSNPSLSAFEAFSPPITSNQTPSSATIAEWTRIGGPDHTIAITGDSFSSFQDSEAGKDTEFMVFGRTSTSTTLTAADTLRLDGPRAAITLPDTLSDKSMYLVWPGNAEGFGRPVAINKTEATWVGPDVASANEQVSIYGMNLTHEGGEDSWVWLQPVDPPNGLYFEGWIEAKGNPYKIDFNMPDGVGSELLWNEYEVWVHNGHGGAYGWSEPMALNIRDALDPGPTSGNSTNGYFDVTKMSPPATARASSSSPTDDDYAGIQAAILAAHDYAGKNSTTATVFFPPGVYDVEQPLMEAGYQNIRFQGTADSITLEPTSIIMAQPDVGTTTTYPNSIFHADNSEYNLHFYDLEINDGGNLRPSDGVNGQLVRFWEGSDISFNNVTFVNEGAQPIAYPSTVDLSGSNYISLKNCYFITNGSVLLSDASQIQVDNCRFEGTYTVHTMLHFQGSSEASVTNCEVKDHDRNDIHGYAFGRFIRGEGTDYNENIYVGNNETIDLAPALPGTSTNGEDFNGGEQINFEAGGPAYYGRPSVTTTDSIRFDNVNLDYLNAFGRLTASIIDGTGLGQRRHVINISKSSGSVTITIDPPWIVVPDSTSIISMAAAQQNVVIYDNDLDGKEEWMEPDMLGSDFDTDQGTHAASTAIRVGGVAHFLAVNNRFSDVRTGIDMIPAQRDTTHMSGSDARPQFDTDFFDYFADNKIYNAVAGIIVGGSPDSFAVGFASAGYGTMQLGTTVRNNEFYEMKKSYVVQGEEAKSFFIGVRTALQYRAAELTIIEGNKYVPLSYRIDDIFVAIYFDGYSSPTLFNSIIRKNDFTSLESSDIGVQFASDGTPALFDNKWGSNATPYAGDFPPGQVLEIPQRIVRFEWTEETLPMNVTVFNAGTTEFKVLAWSDSSWLAVSTENVEIDPESSGVVVITPDLSELGEGTYTATVMVESKDHSQIESFTVVATIAEGDFGPQRSSIGHLPNLRQDQVTVIQAEDFDRGGNGVGFYDPNDDDHVNPVLYPNSTYGVAITIPEEGDWYNYTINVPADGWYRLEARLLANEAHKPITIYYGETSVELRAHDTENWESVRPNDGSEIFIYLSYGVQTMQLSMGEASPDIDWFRLIPVDDDTQAGIPLPYPESTPVISQFGAVTIHAEHYDKGGIGIAYSDDWTGNELSTYRDDELVNIAEYSSGLEHAVVGKEGSWLNFTVYVAQPGTYAVGFYVKNSAGDGKIRLQTPDGVTLFSDTTTLDVVIPTSSPSVFSTVGRIVTFDSPGRKTIQLKFQTNANNDITGYVEYMSFSPVNLMLHGPEAPATPHATASASGKTHVGTVFAINHSGWIDKLRFYTNSTEWLASQPATGLPTGKSHTVQLWKVDSSEQAGGEVTLTPSSSTPLATGTILGTNLKNSDSIGLWNEVDVSTTLLQPGLYVVSVNVVSTLSTSPITTFTDTFNVVHTGVAPPATPSVLTIVAGSYADANSPIASFADRVAHAPFPTVYYWLDVSFTPMY